MEIDRLPVSRAQRISPQATKFLAAHTEDWEKRTFRNVRPKRVLCLIREDLLDIYENKVTARLIDHLLKYLQKRILEVQDLLKKLEQADDFSRDTQKNHWRNRNRICSLWGEQFEAEIALKTAQKTLKTLKKLKYKLRELLDTELYQAIPKHADVGNTLRRTNILINDQHYRYVARLWQAWSPWKRGQMRNALQVFETYQEVFRGFESFCLLLISRALTGNGKADDRGLGFEASNLCIPRRGNSIQFNSWRGNITLVWQHDGILRLEAERIQSLKLVPLLLQMTATSDVTTVSHILNEFQSISSYKQGAQTIILYPGTEEEWQKLPLPLQQKINTLANHNLAKENNFAILPVSPLEIVSVERIARVIQWWFYSQHCQAYPYIIEDKIPGLLLKPNPWIFQEGRQNKLLRPPRPDEAVSFHNSLSRLMNQVKAQGLIAREEFHNLQQLESLPSKAKEQFKPLLICPTCHQESTRFTPLDSQCFFCECKKCESVWGTRICRNCSATYPYLQVLGLDNINPSSHQHVGWIERVLGRNTLAIPCWSNGSASNFICPSCGVCS